MGNARVGLSLAAAIVCGGAWPAYAQSPSPNVSGYVTLGNGYWKHGFAQNDSAVLTLGIDYEHPTGFFTYARATNVDFDVEYYGETRDVEASVYAGYHERHDRWSWTVSLGRYVYPDTGDHYDYNELSFNVGWRDRVFYTTSYNNEYYGDEGRALNQELAVVFPLRGNFEVGGGIGYFEVPSKNYEITHWNVGVSKLIGRTAIDVRYYDGNYEWRSFLGDPDANHFVVNVSYLLRGKRPRN